MKRSTSVRRACCLTLAAIAVAATGQFAHAQTDFFWNVASGDFGDAANWNPNGNPGLFDQAFINNAGTATHSAVTGATDLDRLFVGNNAGDSGTLNVTGGTLRPMKAIFGERGTAVISLSGGTMPVGGGSLFIGGTEGSGATTGNGTLNVSGGPGTSFASGDDFQLGASGTGTLNMSGGTGTGIYTVVGKFGTGVWNHSGGVYAQGGGDIEIGDGGRPDQIGTPGPRTGTINLTGGVIQVAEHVGIGNRNGTGVVNVSGGALALTGRDFSTLFVGRGMDWGVGEGGPTTLRVTGDDAIIAVNGEFQMNPNLVSTASTLVAEITGPTHTTIQVAGNASIANGSFKVELNGYTPVSGDSWTILEAGADLAAAKTAVDALVSGGGYPALTHAASGAAGSLLGNFLSTDLTAPLAPGLSWNVGYADDKVTLSVTGTALFTADFNEDGKVDGADLTVWQGAFNSTAAGDADGDLDSDGADFLLWQQQLGSGLAVSAAAAIPEPSAALLATLGAIVFAAGNRGRTSYA